MNTPPRDVRIDQIGFVDELEEQYAGALRGLVKGRMLGLNIEQVEADFFDARLVSGGLTRTVDPERLLELFEAKSIDRAQFLSALSVANKPLAQFLSADAIDALATRKRTPPRLTISRKETVQVDLVDAIRRLSAELLK